MNQNWQDDYRGNSNWRGNNWRGNRRGNNWRGNRRGNNWRGNARGGRNNNNCSPGYSNNWSDETHINFSRTENYSATCNLQNQQTEDWSDINTQPSLQRPDYHPNIKSNRRKKRSQMNVNKQYSSETASNDSDKWETSSITSSCSQSDSISSDFRHSSISRNSSKFKENVDQKERFKFPTNTVRGNEEKINMARNMTSDLKNLLKSIDPNEMVQKYRQEIHDIAELHYKIHGENLTKISGYIEELGISSKQKVMWEKHHDILKRQLKTFHNYVSDANSVVMELLGQPLDCIVAQGDKIVDKIKKEAGVFKRALPTYAYKSEIVSSVEDNSVTILSADACYYCSALIPMFLENVLGAGKIISCLPNTAMCRMLYENSIAFMHLGSDRSVICYETKTDTNVNKNMKVLFTTNKRLFERLSVDSSLNQYCCAIINCALKRTIEADFVLEKLRQLVKTRKDFKVVILVQPPQDINRFKAYFSAVSVNTLCFPDIFLSVNILWKKGEYCTNFTEEIIKTALAIHAQEECGDVLIYLPSAKDLERVSALLSAELRRHDYQDASCLCVSESSSDLKVFEAKQEEVINERRFILTTSWAEQILFPSVSYVIDPGLQRDHFYDDKNYLEVERLTFISRTRAKVRKISAGRLKCGKCYRLYNRQNYSSDMVSCEVADVLRRNPSDILVQMFQYKFENVMEVEFVDPISKQVKKNALDMLCTANAVKNNQLTRLGERIIKLPYRPRFSKLIIMGIEWGFAFETIVLVALFLVKEQVFIDFHSKEGQKRAEVSKLQFLICDSDTLTFLNIYRSWMESNHLESWCIEHDVNYNALCKVQNKVNSVLKTVTEALKESISAELHKEVEMDCKALQEMIFDCFRDNLCSYTGHFRSGYHLPKAKCMAFLHPSSAVLLRNDLPQFAVFSELQGGSRNYMINMTAVPDDIVLKEAEEGRLNIKPENLYKIKLEPFIIKPVGIILIKNVLLGKGGQNLYNVENRVKQETKCDYVVIEPDEEKGLVTVYTLPENQKEAQEILQNMLQKKKENLLNEEETFPLQLKKGHLNILIDVTWAKGAIASSLKIHCDSVKVATEHSEPNISAQETESVTCSIELSWLRRLCTGTGFLTFSQDDFTVARRLSMKPITIKGNIVNIEVNRKVDNQLFLSNLSSETTEEDIKQAIEKACPSVKITKSTVVREKEFKTTKQHIKSIKKRLTDFLLRSHTSEIFSIVVLIPNDSAISMRAYINFMETIDVSSLTTLFDGFKMEGVQVSAKPSYTSHIFCSKDLSEAIQNQLNKEIERLRNASTDFGNDSSFLLKMEVKDYTTVCFTLRAHSLENINILHSTIHKLLEGRVINSTLVKGLPKLFTHGGHLWLNSLQHKLNIYIMEEYKTKSLRLYGSANACDKAVKRIKEFVVSLENELVKNIDLSTSKSGRALLKCLIRKYGFNMKDFIAKVELRSAEIDVQKSQVILHGSVDNIEKAISEIEDLAMTLDDSDVLLSNQEECCICAMPPNQLAIRLENCGHLYCIECLQGMITNSRFPILCCAESCDKDLILEDLRKALNYDEVEIAQLLNRSMTDYISRNKEYLIYCPVPDCSMFFDKNIVTTNKWKCPLCQNNICTKCKVVYHQGVTCEFYQQSKDDPDYSFKVWMKQNNPNCKLCPKCKTAIEKNRGCNHMTCWSCKAHFCWLCCKAFPTGDDVYRHQPYCPNRYS